MSAFDNWWDNEGRQFRYPLGAAEAAWAAALDELEGLADKWRERCGNKTTPANYLRMADADELLVRIEELREES